MRVKLLTFVVLFTCAQAFAQEKINWPEDPEKKSTAEEKNALYSDAMRIDQEAQAVEPLEWLLTNTPELSESIYINGVKIYETLAEKEKNATKKTAYQDKVMDLYDLRVNILVTARQTFWTEKPIPLISIIKTTKTNTKICTIFLKKP